MELTVDPVKDKSDGSWSLQIVVFLAGDVANGSDLSKLTIDVPELSIRNIVPLLNSEKVHRQTVHIPKATHVIEWWPRGYGAAKLYKVNVVFTSHDGTETSFKSKRIGFRTVALIQKPVSYDVTQGLTFYFKINGMPIFLKGSNWIPADSFPERVTRETYLDLLESTAAANMNSLRVWGGGVYEADEFYDIADELGIMIWQDFMFAVAMYPVDDAFLQNVRDEVRYQIRRLRSHPSIFIFSGNNENEAALVQDWLLTDVNYDQYKADYIALNVRTIKDTVLQEKITVPFVTSSPSNGLATDALGGVAKDPKSNKYGDNHIYDYYSNLWQPGSFQRVRLASEYGIQSWCSFETLSSVYSKDELSFWSSLSNHRQHHASGNIQMLSEISRNLNMPFSGDKEEEFKRLIYVTQINQAMSIQSETEFYRRSQNELVDGLGNTMGALYWQLNDIWQGPTWSSLEYGGKWKMLHYFAKKFFAPTLISPYMDGKTLNVYIVIDELSVVERTHTQDNTIHFEPTGFDIFSPFHPVEKTHSKPRNSLQDVAGTLSIQMFSWDNMTPLHTWSAPYHLNKTGERVFQHNIDSMVRTAGCIRTRNCFLVLYLDNPASGPTAWLPLSRLKDALGMRRTTITISGIRAVHDTEFTITLKATDNAAFVWMEAIGIAGHFSDNGFMLATPTKTVTFFSKRSSTVGILGKSVNIQSLMDVYD